MPMGEFSMYVGPSGAKKGKKKVAAPKKKAVAKKVTPTRGRPEDSAYPSRGADKRQEDMGRIGSKKSPAKASTSVASKGQAIRKADASSDAKRRKSGTMRVGKLY